MTCRRCPSQRLIALEKKLPGDNEVYRCRDCGYLFSPGPSRPAALTTAMEVAPASAARPSIARPEYPAPASQPPAGGN